MLDPSLLTDVAQWLRHPEGRADLVKLLADQEFLDEAKEAAELLKRDGTMPNALRLEYYAESDTPVAVSQATEAAAAFNVPATGRAKKGVAARRAAAQMDALSDL